MKRLAMCVLALSLLALTGCTTRMTDFTVLSTKNVDLSRMGEYERSHMRIEGDDLKSIILFFPTGISNMKEAIDEAIEKQRGGVALVDGVVSHYGWYIPLIYGQSGFVVEGTVLIDPELARGR